MELYAALSLYESRTTAAPAVTGAAFGSGKFVVPVHTVNGQITQST